MVSTLKSEQGDHDSDHAYSHLDGLFKSVTHGTVLPEAEELEALTHRNPRAAGVRLPGGRFEAKLGRVTLDYAITEHPPIVTLTGVRFDG